MKTSARLSISTLLLAGAFVVAASASAPAAAQAEKAATGKRGKRLVDPATASVRAEKAATEVVAEAEAAAPVATPSQSRIQARP